MALVNLPIPTIFSRSSDDTSLPEQVGARLINGYVEKIGDRAILRKLFGMDPIADSDLATDTAIDGLYWWDAKDCLLAVSNGRTYVLFSSTGEWIDITGDALTTIGPVTFASNQHQVIIASGGRMVGINVENLPSTTPALQIATTVQNLRNNACTGWVGQTTFSVAAVAAGTALGTTVIPQGKFGAVALEVTTADTKSVVEATNNAVGYASAAEAIQGIPNSGSTKCRLGVLTIMKSDGAFTLGTTALNASNVTTAYTSYVRDSNTHVQATRFISDTDAPTTVSHVAWLDGYFLANEVNSPRFWWCDADTPFTWGALSFSSAEGHPDNLAALHVAWLEVTLFGRDSLETYYDDGSTPFSRIDGGVLERGCLAPYSIVNAGGTWVWLDNKRRIITLQGRQWSVKSGPYDSIIGNIVDVSGAWAVNFSFGGHTFYAITFPTEDLTVVWNMTTDSWGEWGTWDSNTATYGKWKGKSYAYARTWDMHIIGDSSDSLIYYLRGESHQEASATIRTLMRTAFIDHGTTALKRCRRLLINVKRGEGLAGDEPVFTMRHNTDGRGWSNEVQVGLGEIGEYQHIIELRSLGTYHTRQWEIVHTDNSDFILNGIQEDVEKLEE